MKNKKWFTLLEVLLSVVILWMFIWIIINIYIQIRWSDWKISNKRTLTAEASDLIDVIHEAAIEYTIDYEEYFNRRGLWYWVWNTWFTSYGNDWILYYCWSSRFNNNNKYEVYPWGDDGWCFQDRDNQKYFEYFFQHWKLSKLTELNSSWNKNSYTWMWPVAIDPNTWLDYLYLINHDGTERFYFRRVFITWIDLNWDWIFSWVNENLYAVQMLKLKWFDAWTNHDYKQRWSYDWFIDTRACDISQWYYCHWDTWLNNWYSLPLNYDDWWVNITSDKVTVSDMKIDIYPIKDPYLATNEDSFVIDPYAKISFTMNIFWEDSNDEITLTTTLSFKNSYSRFPIVEYTWYYWPAE